MCVCILSYVKILNGYLVYRVDFEYLKDLPILVLDVNEDFKNDRIKQEGVVDKVRASLWTNCKIFLINLDHILIFLAN